MNILEIKEFTAENLAAVQRLTKALGSDTTHLTEAYFKEMLASDSNYLFFLSSEKDIAGMLTVGIYKSPTGTKAWIEDVVVEEIYRGKGFGKQLVEHAISFSKSLGADSLMLTSRPVRIAANKLYQSLGFEMRETNVYKMTFQK